MNLNKQKKNPMSLNKGIWDQFTADKYHQSSKMLAEFLASYLPDDKMVIDFGCGNGFYLKELTKHDYACIGVEGFKLNNFLHPNISILDLSKEIYLGVVGSVISLEVGEHIPKESEQIFIDNITRHCSSKLILSWALPDQPGIGHINCQPQEYIISEIQRRGFSYRSKDTQFARTQIDENCDWFRRTLLIFDRN